MDSISNRIEVTLTLIALIVFFLLTKRKKGYPDFYQARIVRLSYLLRLYLPAYGQTLCIIFICSSFLFSLHLSSLSKNCIDVGKNIAIDIDQNEGHGFGGGV